MYSGLLRALTADLGRDTHVATLQPAAMARLVHLPVRRAVAGLVDTCLDALRSASRYCADHWALLSYR